MLGALLRHVAVPPEAYSPPHWLPGDRTQGVNPWHGDAACPASPLWAPLYARLPTGCLAANKGSVTLFVGGRLYWSVVLQNRPQSIVEKHN